MYPDGIRLFPSLTARFEERMHLAKLYERAHVRLSDWMLGIRSEYVISPKILGFDNPDCREYAALDYRIARLILAALAPTKDDVFLDFGCGMGRILALAAPKVGCALGVELSKDLAAIARRNLRARKNAEIIQGDAAAFPIPPTATVAFAFNPFSGETLDHVLSNVRASIVNHPRRFRFACAFPDGFAFQKQIESVSWLTPTWQSQQGALRCAIFEALKREPGQNS